MDGKKLKGAMVGMLGQIVVMIIVAVFAGFGVEIDTVQVATVVIGIAGLFGVQIGAQGYADGKSGGLTSSNAQIILDASAKATSKNSSDPVSLQAG